MSLNERQIGNRLERCTVKFPRLLRVAAGVVGVTVGVAACGDDGVTSEQAAATKAAKIVRQQAREARVELGRAVRDRKAHDPGQAVKIAREIFPKFTGYAPIGYDSGMIFDQSTNRNSVSVELAFFEQATAQSGAFPYTARVVLCVGFTVVSSAPHTRVRVRTVHCPPVTKNITVREHFDRVVSFNGDRGKARIPR